MFKKYQLNEQIEFRPVYFNSTRKTDNGLMKDLAGLLN